MDVLVSRADGSNLHVHVADSGPPVLVPDVLRVARVSGAGTSLDAWDVSVHVEREVRVEPEHPHCRVVPNAHDKYHTSVKSLTHGAHASLVAKGVLTSLENVFLDLTIIVR